MDAQVMCRFGYSRFLQNCRNTVTMKSLFPAQGTVELKRREGKGRKSWKCGYSHYWRHWTSGFGINL